MTTELTYAAEDADAFWSDRVKETDDLAAVLYYGMPRAFNEAYSEWEVNSLMNAMGDIRGARVLDLGCGNGRLAVPLSRAGARVTAVDNASGMLAECRARIAAAGTIETVKFHHMSASEVDLPEGSFDVAVCVGLLEHLPPEQQKRAVASVVEATSESGSAFFTASNPNSILLKRWQGESQSSNRGDQAMKGFHINLISVEWLREELAAHSMTCEVVSSNAFLAFALHAYRGCPDTEEMRESWDELFTLMGRFDTSLREKGDVDELVAELYVLCARHN